MYRPGTVLNRSYSAGWGRSDHVATEHGPGFAPDSPRALDPYRLMSARPDLTWTESSVTPDDVTLRLLVVDDDDVDRMAVRRALAATALRADIEEATTAEAALAALKGRRFDCVLLDNRLPGHSGLEFIREARRLGVDAPVVMLTGQNDPEIAVAQMKGGAVDFLPKGTADGSLSADRLEAVIRAAVRVHRAERALHAGQAWASTALRSIGDAVVTTDAHGRVTFLNRAAEELTGRTMSNATGYALANVADVVPEGGEGPALHERLAQVLAGRTAVSQADMVLRGADGRRVPVDARVARIRADRVEGAPPGAAVGAVLVLRDITDRKAAERALEAARADADRARMEAEAANRAKSEFLATMSHELRTPLNAIGGFTQLIADGIYGPLLPKQVEALDRIKRAQELLLGLINAVLDFAKVQAGSLRLAVTDFDVQHVLDDVRPLVVPQMLAKALALDVRVDKRVAPVRARADRDKVQQIVLNLLSNATKFTPRGGRVTLAWAVEGDHVCVTISDTGIGIPAERLDVIFEPFVQLGSDRTTIGQGTGLGLAISRDLARSMGGDLTAASEVGVGSTFTLIVPAARG